MLYMEYDNVNEIMITIDYSTLEKYHYVITNPYLGRTRADMY